MDSYEKEIIAAALNFPEQHKKIRKEQFINFLHKAIVSGKTILELTKFFYDARKPELCFMDEKLGLTLNDFKEWAEKDKFLKRVVVIKDSSSLSKEKQLSVKKNTEAYMKRFNIKKK